MSEVFQTFYKDFFVPGADFLDHIINYFIAISAIVSIVCFFIYIYFPIIYPLRKFFGQQGLTFGEACRLFLICRTQPYKHVRLYIEFAIIKSCKESQAHSWWHKLRYQFADLIKRNPDSICINIDNCSDLLNENVKKNINRYFRFIEGKTDIENRKNKFKKFISHYLDERWYRHNKKRNGIKELSGFLSEITIKEGYLAPMAVITGLNERFKDNWIPILKNYNRSLNSDKNSAILPEELYFSFNWLMWGPSYSIPYQEKEKSCIMLYGYGDEANSINVVTTDISKIMELRYNIEEEDTRHNPVSQEYFGSNAKITVRVVDAFQYYEQNCDNLETNSAPFIKRISQGPLSTPFILQLESSVKVNLYQKNNISFFSAYLWIMFTVNGESFSPSQSVTFFEHANLPNADNYKFLTECLIEKTFNYFRKIQNNSDKQDCNQNKRKYRYCLSMNHYIEERFKKKLQEYQQIKDDPYGNWLSENLLAESKVDISTVLDAFDNYFLESSMRKLKNTEEDHISLGSFYARSYYSALKKQKNHPTLNNMMHILSKDSIDSGLFAAFNNKRQIIGITLISSIDSKNCGIIHVLIEKENFKNCGEELITQTYREIGHTHLCSGLEYQKFILLCLPDWSDEYPEIINNLQNFFNLPAEIKNNTDYLWLINSQLDNSSVNYKKNCKMIKQITKEFPKKESV